MQRKKVGTCAYCGEDLYTGEEARQLVAGFVHERCWERYVAEIVPNQRVRLKEVPQDGSGE